MKDTKELLAEIVSRLERLGALRITGGQNIDVAEADSRIIISSKGGSDFSNEFKLWMLDVQRKIDSMPEFESGPGIIIEKNPGQVRISSTVESQPSGKGQTVQASGEVLYFPFKTIYDSTLQKVVVTGYNFSAGRYYRNLAVMGFYTPVEVAETAFDPLSGWIYLELSYDTDGFHALLKSVSDLPSQAESKYIVPIASVYIDSGSVVNISQIQFGNVVIAGRVV